MIGVGLDRSGLTTFCQDKHQQCLSTPGLSLCTCCGFLSARQLSLLEPSPPLETRIIKLSQALTGFPHRCVHSVTGGGRHGAGPQRALGPGAGARAVLADQPAAARSAWQRRQGHHVHVHDLRAAVQPARCSGAAPLRLWLPKAARSPGRCRLGFS